MAFEDFTIDKINEISKDTMPEFMGIEFTEIGEDFIKAKMLVTNKVVQPMRLLHGGASVAFAETMGSIMGLMCVPNYNTHTVVGLEINANHIRGVKEGNMVYAICRPLHVGRTTIICEIKINNEQEKLVCMSRITLAVIPINK
jgi:1,4-dihydroxy-2-naphthoyl-CoA hydrolase